MKHESAIAWICACDHPYLEYGQCTPQKPFKSLDRAKTAEHERGHIACIKNHEVMMRQVAKAPRIIGKELRVGTWDDWKGILDATKVFAKFVHEHQGIYRRSFFISGAGDNLIRAVERIVWCQSKEGAWVRGERLLGKVSRILDAMFDDIKRRGERKRRRDRSLRSFSARMGTATKLIAAIKREVAMIERKFPDADGLSEVKAALQVCERQMGSELRQSHEESP